MGKPYDDCVQTRSREQRDEGQEREVKPLVAPQEQRDHEQRHEGDEHDPALWRTSPREQEGYARERDEDDDVEVPVGDGGEDVEAVAAGRRSPAERRGGEQA